MNKLILVLFSVIQIYAFTGRVSAFSAEFIAKFEITHSHHYDHKDHHQHGHDEIELDAKNVHSDIPSEEHTHRHEIIVSSHIPFIQSDTAISSFKVEKLIPYPKLNQEPPQDPCRPGIFRPPILA